MSRVFNFEGPVFTTLSRLADLFWLNLLFILCCIPVFTIGAATTALYYVTLKMAKDEEGYITKSYFKAFKQNFIQATIIWVVILLIMGIMLADLRIANGGNVAGIFTDPMVNNVVVVAVGVMVILLAMTVTYVFPILAQFDNTVLNTVKNAFLISIRHLPYTIAMIFIAAVPVALIWFSPAMLLLVLIMFSAVAYINSKFFNKIFVLYMPKDETGEDMTEPVEGINGES